MQVWMPSFDNTNNELTFVDEVLVLLEVFAKARLDGVKTPQISFILPIFDYDFVATQLRELYRKSILREGTRIYGSIGRKTFDYVLPWEVESTNRFG